MSEKIKYGKHIKIRPLDTNGSVHKTVTNYRGEITEEKNYFEIRTKVKNETEELAETVRFMKEKAGKNRSTHVEVLKNTSDYYYLIKCWEE